MVDFLINTILFFVPLVFLLIPNNFLGALAYALFTIIFMDLCPQYAQALFIMPIVCLILNFLCFSNNKRGK
jgi:hypothetical protein